MQTCRIAPGKDRKNLRYSIIQLYSYAVVLPGGTLSIYRFYNEFVKTLTSLPNTNYVKISLSCLSDFLFISLLR